MSLAMHAVARYLRVTAKPRSSTAARARDRMRKPKGSAQPPAKTSASSSVIPSTGHASRLRRCSRVVSISLRKPLARMPVCDGCAHPDGFPFAPKD